jgi:hypothetical protein
MSITFTCPECRQELEVRNTLAGLSYRCWSCRSPLKVPELAGVSCSASTRADRRHSSSALEYARTAAAGSAEDRPWTPMQILASCLLFGAGAGGAVAGINFARLGKRHLLVPCILLGAVAFLVTAVVCLFLVRGDQAARLAGLGLGMVVGLGFLLAQKPYFDAWKMVNWAPRGGEKYRPNRLGQLCLVCFGCLALEVGVIALLIVLGLGM